MDKNYIVKKSNFFIMNSSYDLSLEEQKLILTIASMVQPMDEDFKPYKFKINEFMKLLGVNTKTKYTEIPKITKELMKKVFEIEEDDTIIQTAWLSSATYKKGSGMVELEFSPRLKPYMLKLNSMFTQYKLDNILSMKSKYAPRIYEILKCNEFKKQGYIEIDIDELRKLLKVENVYPRYNDFKRKVIEKSQEELEEKTDIKFKIEEIKTGRKVTSIKFFISKNDYKSKNKDNKILDEVSVTLADNIKDDNIRIIVDMMKDHNIGHKEALSIYNSAKGDMKYISKVYEHFKYKESENFVGLMISMVKPGKFSEPNPSNKQLNFNNFTGRGPDYYGNQDLERKLLGWDKDKDEE